MCSHGNTEAIVVPLSVLANRPNSQAGGGTKPSAHRYARPANWRPANRRSGRGYSRAGARRQRGRHQAHAGFANRSLEPRPARRLYAGLLALARPDILLLGHGYQRLGTNPAPLSPAL